ncbi:MAG: hypothetical protein E6J78_13515 [Deltaproteobacteria bacterium]|nr:MAG: hypothetical protein E6J78_13515 [Deltaproteobacteria bacterium]
MTNILAGLFLAALPAVVLAQAPANPPVRIRGTIEKLEGQNLTIKDRSGQSVSVKLADNFMVVGLFKGTVADIGSGKFIGTTTVGERDGALVAHEVHIFPENMRGTGEGHYDWDLKPKSKMTNANVAKIVKMAGDQVMTVQYKGGEKQILVTKDTVVVTYKPVDKSELKPGAPVFVIAQKQPDGSLTAARVNVGMNGQVPPM